MLFFVFLSYIRKVMNTKPDEKENINTVKLGIQEDVN